MSPECRAGDAERPRVEDRVEARFLLPLVVAQCFEGWLLEDEDADDIEPRHQTDADSPSVQASLAVDTAPIATATRMSACSTMVVTHPTVPRMYAS